MKVHGVYFYKTDEAYEYMMKHVQYPVTDCIWCYPIERIESAIKRPRRSKRKSLHPELRARVYNRSKMMCEECGDTGKAIHHIKSVSEYPGEQFDLDNLIHLCSACHANRHKNMKPELFIYNLFVTQARVL